MNALKFRGQVYALLLFFWILGLISPIHPNPQTIRVSEKQSQEKIGRLLEIIEDKEHTFTPEDVFLNKKEAFKLKNSEEIPNLGFSDSQFWLKFRVKNDSSEEKNYLVEVEFSGLDHLEFFSYGSDNQIQSILTGDLELFSTRPIPHKNFLFPIKIEPGNSSTYVLRVKSETSVFLPINVWATQDFYMRDYRALFLFGTFFGISVIMTLFHHLLYYSFRDKSFLLFSFNILSSSLFLGTYHGFIYQYIIPEYPKINSGTLQLCIYLIILTGIQFEQEFLSIKAYSIKLYNNLNFFFLGVLGFLCISPFLSFTMNIKISSFIAVLWNCITFGIAIYLLKRKNPFAKFYILGSCIYLFFLLILVLSNFSLFPRNILTMYGLLISFSSQMILFSLGMGTKLQILREEKAEIERKSTEFKEKLSSIQMEIDTASRIHRTILPSEIPRVPGLDLYAVYIPSNTIGGDFYDFHEKGGNLGIFIADVTGHGIPASLFASSVKYCFSKGVKYFVEPNRLLSYMNSSLYQKLGNQLLTAGYLLVSPEKKTLSYASCGHPPLLLYKKNQNKLLEIKPKGTMIGIHQDTNIEKVTVSIEQGDRILLYTDGVTECSNSQGEEFGNGHLEDFLKRSIGLRAKSTSNLLLKNLSKFSGAKVRYQDDITYIVVDIL